VVFRVDLRVAAADLLPPAEPFVVVLARLGAAFFVAEGRFLRLGGFSVVPVTTSATLLAALDTLSMTASMPVLAASVIVPRTPSCFSLSMLFTSRRVTL
jgi:hypothetical protein